MSLQSIAKPTEAAVKRRQANSISKFEKTLTIQSLKEQCCVNRLVQHHKNTGVMWQTTATPQYMDVSDIPDFQTAAQSVVRAQQSFDALPANIRKEFHNDPVEFVQFATDPKNHDKMVEMGLKDAPKTLTEPKGEPAPQQAEAKPEAIKNAEKST